MTARQLAALMGCHPSKLSRFENGAAMPSVADLRAWCRHTKAEGEAEDLVAALHAVETMWTEWRRLEALGLSRSQQTVAELTDYTRQFRAYSSWLIPGVVQTTAYADAIMRGISERRGLVDDVEDAVAMRAEWQTRMLSGRQIFALLIEESVLRAGMGGPAVMAAQLGHLLTCFTLRNVSIGIVPAGPNRHTAWPVEDFWILDDGKVSVELISGWLMLTNPREIALYEQAFARLSESAVFGAKARSLIADAIQVLGD